MAKRGALNWTLCALVDQHASPTLYLFEKLAAWLVAQCETTLRVFLGDGLRC